MRQARRRLALRVQRRQRLRRRPDLLRRRLRQRRKLRAVSDDASDVLIVGAGPTGLTLACELARRGVSFRIIDQLPQPNPLPRAIGLQARTLEILEDIGIAEAVVRAGLPLHGVDVYSSGRQLVKASFEELDTHYPFLLAISQPDSERILSEQLRRLGGAVERGLELVGLVQHEAGVDARLRGAGGQERSAPARWLIGADGSQSAVRQLIGLELRSSGEQERFWLADVRWDCELPGDRITTFFAEAGVLACFPLPGMRWRLIAAAPGDEPADAIEPPTVEELQALVDERGPPPRPISDPSWLARFRVHGGQVEHYRSGRVFLAGDAAQTHSPIGSQGLNSGIQDAHNLGWKLALVARGLGRPELLDSYHAERHAIGVALVRGTDFATRVASFKHPILRAVRNRVAGFLSALELVQQRITRSVTELDLSYRRSPIVDEHRSSVFRSRLGGEEHDERPTVNAWWAFDSAPSAGDRAPDGLVLRSAHGEPLRLAQAIDGRQHTLLLFDGRAATTRGYGRLTEIARAVEARYRELVDVHVIVPAADRPEELEWRGSVLLDPFGELEDRYGARAECLYLLRPDLYIGFRSQPADQDALFAYLESIFI
jgi:2-polyprenyl-6-methoxyphenol hydroxylase-like FAD-dependent oxidoreductase